MSVLSRVLNVLSALLFIATWASIILIEKSLLWIIPIMIIGIFVVPIFSASLIYEYLMPHVKRKEEVFFPIRMAYDFRIFFKYAISLGFISYVVFLIVDWEQYILYGLVIPLMLAQAYRYQNSVFFIFRKMCKPLGIGLLQQAELFNKIVVNKMDNVDFNIE